MVLFHVSEQKGIERFEPRAIDESAEPLVWAVDDDRLRNYLVPRDCPRSDASPGSGRPSDSPGGGRPSGRPARSTPTKAMA